MKPYMLFHCDCSKTYRIDIKELKPKEEGLTTPHKDLTHSPELIKPATIEVGEH